MLYSQFEYTGFVMNVMFDYEVILVSFHSFSVLSQRSFFVKFPFSLWNSKLDAVIQKEQQPRYTQ